MLPKNRRNERTDVMSTTLDGEMAATSATVFDAPTSLFA
jgi:hypothetical protein